MPQARAQSLDSSIHSLDWAYQPPIFQTPMMRGIVREAVRRMSGTAKAQNDGKTPKKAPATTTYRESPAVSQRVAKGFTDWIVSQAAPGEATFLRRSFDRDGLEQWARGSREQWTRAVKRMGLKRGDVADALAGYWVINWQIANRSAGDRKPAQVRAVRAVFASVLASNPAFAKTSDAGRQEIAETYIHNAIFQASAFLEIVYSENNALLQRASNARDISFKRETGLDLRTVKLTDAGFAAKS